MKPHTVAKKYWGVQLIGIGGALLTFLAILIGLANELFVPHVPPVNPLPALAAPKKIFDVAIYPQRPNHPTAGYGTLNLKVKPWAEVYIDDEFYGTTPINRLRLPVGEYLVKLRNPDYPAIALRMVKIYADKRTELNHHFQ